jgi:non-specific serine/threonine protein kinase
MHLAAFGGDLAGSRVFAERCLSLARRVGDLWAEAFSLGYEAICESDLGNFQRSAALASEARAIALESTHIHAHTPQALASRMLGYGALQEGDLRKAGNLFEEAVALQRALRVLEGRHEDAGALAREALGYCHSLGDRRGMGWCLQTIAMVAAAQAQPSRSARIYGAAEALLRSIGATGQVTVTRLQDRYVRLAMDALGDSTFLEAAREGRAMSLERILDEALHR